jgi:hypothetical protein
MDVMCPVSCATFVSYTENCEAWDDPNCDDDACKLWAHVGKCASEPDYMLKMCPQMCNPVPFRYTENC